MPIENCLTPPYNALPGKWSSESNQYSGDVMGTDSVGFISQGAHKTAGPLKPIAPERARAVRDALADAGFMVEPIVAMMRRCSLGGSVHPTLAGRWTDEPTVFNQLFRLFALGRSASASVLREGLGEPVVESLQDCGLLAADGDDCERLRSVAKLLPFKGVWVLSDFTSQITGRPLGDDHVLGAGGASETLAALTPRRRVRRVLDLGAGSGVQSFLAAAHADHVVGTDVNRRAMNFAGLGAAMNGLAHFEQRYGSLFEPVAGERFDLIVANPPFVISPDRQFMYRDGGLGGDELSRRVISVAADHLTEGGKAVVLCNWYHRDDDDWPDRPLGWAPAHNCDVWLIKHKTVDPLTYAAEWLAPTDSEDRAHFAQSLERWTGYFGAVGANRISGGAVVLQRRTGVTNWRRCDDLDQVARSGDCGDQIERICHNMTWLTQHPTDEALFAERLKLMPGHVISQTMTADQGEWQSAGLKLCATAGIVFEGEIDTHAATMIARCDGTTPLRDLFKDVTDRVDESAERVAQVCAQVARQLLRSGVLSVVQMQPPN